MTFLCCTASANTYIHASRLPTEMLGECLQHMPIVDLARLLATSKVFRKLAAKEITIQVKLAVKQWVPNEDAFFHLLKVRPSSPAVDIH